VSDPATLAFYEANARRYSHDFRQAHSRCLDVFLDRLVPGARILELGCGDGRDSARMAERGFAVDPTDASAAMVAKAREGFGLPARRMRFDELDASEGYDAVWAHACLIHVARADFSAVLAAVRRALRAGGWHFASFKLGEGDGRDPLGRLTNFPDEAWLENSYRAAGFAIVATERYRGEGADGVVRDWYALTVRKESS
jgi:SAM-dependent methyltransferase